MSDMSNYAIAAFLGLCMGYGIGACVYVNIFQNQAVAHKAASYIPSEDKNTVIFKWNDEAK